MFGVTVIGSGEFENNKLQYCIEVSLFTLWYNKNREEELIRTQIEPYTTYRHVNSVTEIILFDWRNSSLVTNSVV